MAVSISIATPELDWELPLRLVTALVLTGLIGLERERGHKPAGLRTHMLVGLGAACFTLATLGIGQPEREGLPPAAYPHDPIRLVQGLIGGIGFLGAGAIIRRDETVQGLTTAGTIWLAGAVGMSAGLGQHTLAVATVLLALVVLRGLSVVERRWLQASPTHPPENPAQPGSRGGTEDPPAK